MEVKALIEDLENIGKIENEQTQKKYSSSHRELSKDHKEDYIKYIMDGRDLEARVKA